MMQTPAQAASVRQIAAYVAALLYAAAYCTLAISGAKLWHTAANVLAARIAWSVAFVMVLAVGWVAHVVLRGGGRSVFRVGLATQLDAGAMLLGYWAVKTTT